MAYTKWLTVRKMSARSWQRREANAPLELRLKMVVTDGPASTKNRDVEVLLTREEIMSLVVELAAQKDWLSVLQAVVHEDSAMADTLKDASLSLFEKSQLNSLFTRYRNFRAAAQAALKD